MVIYSHSERSFTTEEVLSILHNPDWTRVITEPPIKPRAGTVFLYHYKDERKKDDWRCDQYHFQNDGIRKQPRTNPKINKSFFVIRNAAGKKERRFKKHAYRLLQEHNNLVLFQYFGDESHAVDLPHGNSSDKSKLYIRVCPSTIASMKTASLTADPAEVLQNLEDEAKTTSVPDVHKPRSLFHIQNTRCRVKRKLEMLGKKRSKRKGNQSETDRITAETCDTSVLENKNLSEDGPLVSPEVAHVSDGTLPVSPDVQSPQTRLNALADLCANICLENMGSVATSVLEDEGDVQCGDVLSRSYAELTTISRQDMEHIQQSKPSQHDLARTSLQQTASGNTAVTQETSIEVTSHNESGTQCHPFSSCDSSDPNHTNPSNRRSTQNNNTCTSESEGTNGYNNTDTPVLVCVPNSGSTESITFNHSVFNEAQVSSCFGQDVVYNCSVTTRPSLEQFAQKGLSNGVLKQVVETLKQLLQCWGRQSSGTDICPRQDILSCSAVVSAGAASAPSPSETVPNTNIHGSAPETVTTIITQTSSVWKTDFDMTRQLLTHFYAQELMCIKETEDFGLLKDLLSAIIVGSYKTNTRVIAFIETLNECPSHLVPHENIDNHRDIGAEMRFKIGQYTLYGKDILRLDDGGWLDDSVIHAYLHLLQKQHAEEDGGEVLVLECFLYNKWENSNYQDWIYNEVNLFSVEWIILPVCQDSHWVLLVANVRDTTVSVINSKPCSSLETDIFTHWRMFMRHRGVTTGEMLTDWTQVQYPVYPQTDGSSCGVFVLMTAEAVLRGASPGIMRNCHVTMYRKYVLNRLVGAAKVVQMEELEVVELAINGLSESGTKEPGKDSNGIQNCSKLAGKFTPDKSGGNKLPYFPLDSHVPDSDKESNIEISDSNLMVASQSSVDMSTGSTYLNSKTSIKAEYDEPSNIEIHPPMSPKSFCRDLFENHKLHFASLIFLCLEKGEFDLTRLGGKTDKNLDLTSHIEWSCVLSGIDRVEEEQVEDSLCYLREHVIITDNNVARFRYDASCIDVTDLLSRDIANIIAGMDMKFLYKYLTIKDSGIDKDDSAFLLTVDRANEEDLANRFAQEIVEHNFALPLTHHACTKHSFRVLFIKAVRKLSRKHKETIDDIAVASDSVYGGSFLDWVCFGENAGLYNILSYLFPDDHKKNSVITCCVSGNADVLQLMLEELETAEVVIKTANNPKISGMHKSKRVETFDTHLLPPLHLACYYGHVSIVKCLLQHKCDVNVQLGEEFIKHGLIPEGSTPGCLAAARGHDDVLQCLLAHGADLDLVDWQYNSPLHLSCKDGNIHSVSTLLTTLCKLSEQNISGNTPLHIACDENRPEIVNSLLERKADASVLNYNNDLPLDIACQKGCCDVVKLLLATCPYSLPYDGSNTPLHKACAGGYADIVILLLKHGALKSVNNDERYPLSLAIKTCQLQIAGLLLDNTETTFLKRTQCLTEVSKNGHTDIVKLLIEKGADVSGTDRSGYSPLYWACVNGHTDIVKLLIEKGADVSGTDDGYSPLERACVNGHTDIVKLLIEKGADVSGTGRYGYSPLVRAYVNGHTDIVKLLIEKGADVSGTDRYGYSPLERACVNGHTDIVKLLIEKGADVSGTGRYGYSPLYWACENGHTDIVKLLIEKGADVSGTDDDGYSPLERACENGHTDIVKLLIEKGADVSGTDDDGYSPLERAYVNGHTDIVKLLIEKGADVSGTDDDGYSPLERACENGHTDIVKLLIEKGADVSGTDRYGYSPLERACVNGHTDIVKLLIEKGADVSGTGRYGYSPLYWACVNGHTDIVKLLIEKGADVSGTDDDGYSPLERACENGHTDIVKLLIEKGADVSGTDDDGYSPLERAYVNGHTDIVKLLIEKGADVSGTDDDGYSPLERACENGHTDIVKLLIEKGADVSGTDRYGYSPLVRACENGHTDIVKLLIEKGADVSGTDDDGYSPLERACVNGHTDIVKLLIEKVADAAGPGRDYNLPLYWDSLSLCLSHGYVDIAKLLVENGADVVETGCKKIDNKVVQSLFKTHITHLPWNLCKVLLQSVYAEGNMHMFRVLAEHVKTKPLYDQFIIQLLKESLEHRRFAIFQMLFALANEKVSDDLMNIASAGGYVRVCEQLIKSDCTAAGSCLISALKIGNSKLTEMLIEAGSNVRSCDDKENSTLHIACTNGDSNIVDMLIKGGVHVDSINKQSETPLHVACKTGCMDTVKCLLNAGADITKQEGHGFTALHITCKTGNIKLVHCIVQHCLDIQTLQASTLNNGNPLEIITVQHILNGISKDGESPLHIACRQNHAEVVKLLLKYEANIFLLDKKGITAVTLGWNKISLFSALCDFAPITPLSSDDKGNSLLHLACQKGHSGCVRSLCERGANVFSRNSSGEYPVHKAAENDDVGVMEILISHGADTSATDNESQTPLHVASSEGSMKMVKFFIRTGVHINARDQHHSTPLHLSCKAGYADIASTLLRAGADTDTTDIKLNSPLIYASERGHVECVHVLLKNDANINLKGHRGNTPLHRASAQGQADVVSLLLLCGADPMIQNISRRIALQHAILWGHMATVDILFDRCRSWLSSNICILLSSACKRGHMEILKKLLAFAQTNANNISLNSLFWSAAKSKQFHIVKLLQNMGCNVKQKDDFGKNILHKLCEEEDTNEEDIQKALDLGVDVSDVTNKGQTALHLIGKTGNADLVNVFINKRTIDIRTSDRHGNTCLHTACMYGQLGIASSFIQNGCDINEKNSEGCTAVDVAIGNKQFLLEKLLDQWHSLSQGYAEINIKSFHQIILESRIELLSKCDILLYETDADGNTPLHIACSESAVEIVKMLMKADAGARIYMTNTSGDTPVHIASHTKDPSLLKTILDEIRLKQLLKDTIAQPDSDGNTPLHITAYERNANGMKLLLENGADMNSMNNSNQTALHVACYGGDEFIISKLLNENSAMSAEDKNGNTPLHVACMEGNVHISRLLLQNHADVNTVNQKGRTPLHESLYGGHFELAVELMNHMDDLTQTDIEGNSYLHVVCRKGNEECVTILTERASHNEFGETPMHYAAESGNSNIVNELLRRGYSLNVTNNRGETPLYFSSSSGKTETVRQLIAQGCNPNHCNTDELSPLHIASRNGHICAVLMLGSETNIHARTGNGHTSLHLACQSGHVEVAEVLLKAGSDIIAKDNNFDTSLHLAARSDRQDVIVLLTKWGMTDAHVNKYGDTALHVACTKGYVDTCKKLLKINDNILLENNNKQTPLTIVTERECNAILELLLHRLWIMSRIEKIHHKTNLTQCKYIDHLNRCLTVACCQNRPEAVKLLLKHDADVNCVSKLKTDKETTTSSELYEIVGQAAQNVDIACPTPLHIACWEGHVEIAELLIKAGAHLEAKTNTGDTSMHMASTQGHTDIVSLLLKYGGSPSQLGANMTTPLHSARQRGYADIVQILLAAEANTNSVHLAQMDQCDDETLANNLPSIQPQLKRKGNELQEEETAPRKLKRCLSV